MRLHTSIIIATATTLTVLLMLTDCGGKPQVAETPARSACIELMQKVPVYYEGFEFWDARTLQSDPDLEEMCKVWQEREGDFLEVFGIDSSNIDYLASAEVLTLVRGNFGPEDVGDSLEEDYYRDKSYQNMEIWVAKPDEEPPSRGGAYALTEGLFVWGNEFNIEDYLRVIRGDELSLYDKNADELLQRLPQGIMTRISREPYPEGLVISGMSVEKEEKSTLRWTNVYKFQSAEYVSSAETEEYFQRIEDEWKEAERTFAERGEPGQLHTFTIEEDGEFVEWSMLIDEKYMIALLFYG
jgi:hypothetical protein